MNKGKGEPVQQTDVTVTDCGSIVLFKPETEEAKAWIAANVQTEGWQWMGPALAVDHRYAINLAEGMAEDGLVVSQ